MTLHIYYTSGIYSVTLAAGTQEQGYSEDSLDVAPLSSSQAPPTRQSLAPMTLYNAYTSLTIGSRNPGTRLQ